MAATRYLERLIRRSHKRVQLLAQHPDSHSGSRPRRSVRVKLHGRWRDVGTTMLQHGDVLWLPNAREWAWNGRYSALAAQAAARGRRLWSRSGCGRGPRARLRLWVNWQGHASEFANVPGEWVRIKNLDLGHSVSLGGWLMRTSDLRRYRFTGNVRVPAGGDLTLHVDRGRNTATDRFWGLGRPVFDNVTEDARKLGDGAYLFDPRGNMRAHMQYPCRFRCNDPLRNKVAVGAAPDGRDEYATVTNVSGGPVNLEGYQVAARVFNYSFGPESVLRPGQTMRVYVDGSPNDDTALVKYAGLSGPLLPNAGDRIQLRTYDDIRVACRAWGAGSCSS